MHHHGFVIGSAKVKQKIHLVGVHLKALHVRVQLQAGQAGVKRFLQNRLSRADWV